MKQTTYIFLLSLFLFLAKSSKQSNLRKLETDYDMTLMGFERVRNNENSSINFRTIFIKLTNETIENLTLESSITYRKNKAYENSTDTTTTEAYCYYERDLNNNYASYYCNISTLDKFNITQLEIINATDKIVNYSSLAENSKEDILNETRRLYIFNLTNITKNNRYILKGNMHRDFSDTDNFKFDDIKGLLNCQYEGNSVYECILSPTGEIENISINEKEAISEKSKIYIMADNAFINFPLSNTSQINVSIFSVGNFTESTESEDAKGTIFLKGPIYKLLYLEDYLGFNVSITYQNNKTGSQEKKNIQVKGEKNTTDLYKGIISYDLNYQNTKGSTILKMESPSNIIFSIFPELNETSNNSLVFEGNEYYAFLEDKIIDYIPMNLAGGKNAIANDDSFYFDFEDNEINVADSAINLSYIPDEENRTSIICNLKEINSGYRIICSPKKNVYAPLSSVRIDITNLNKTSRLRILEKTTNTSLFVDEESPGYIDYTYNPKLNGVFRNKNSGGLSRGEIAAIVIASVIAVLAVIFLLYFFNRPPAPIIKNNNDIKLENSTTNINK